MANNEKSTVDLAHLANSTREDRQGNGSNLEGEGLTAPPRTDATLMLRAQSDEPDPTDGKIIVAVSRKTLTEDLAALVTELNDLWAKACSRVSRPNVGWCKAGAVMWDQASIEVPPSGSASSCRSKASTLTWLVQRWQRCSARLRLPSDPWTSIRSCMP
jgi:hypothetical protein